MSEPTPEQPQVSLASRATSALRLTLAFLTLNAAVLGAIEGRRLARSLAVLFPPEDWQRWATPCTTERLAMNLHLPPASGLAERLGLVVGMVAVPLLAVLLALAMGWGQRAGYRLLARRWPASPNEEETKLWRAFCQELERRVGKPVETVLLAQGYGGPFVCGGAKAPLVVVHLSWLRQQEGEEEAVKLVARHEAEHVRSQDLFFVHLAFAFLWLIPLVLLPLVEVNAWVLSGPLFRDAQLTPSDIPWWIRSVAWLSEQEEAVRAAWFALLGWLLFRRAMRARELAADRAAYDEALSPSDNRELLQRALRPSVTLVQPVPSAPGSLLRAMLAFFASSPMRPSSVQERKESEQKRQEKIARGWPQWLRQIPRMVASHPPKEQRLDAMEGRPVEGDENAWTMFLTLGAALGLVLLVVLNLQGQLSVFSVREGLAGGGWQRVVWSLGDWLPVLGGPLALLWVFYEARSATLTQEAGFKTILVRLVALAVGAVLPRLLEFRGHFDVVKGNFSAGFVTLPVSAPVLALALLLLMGIVVVRTRKASLLASPGELWVVAVADVFGFFLGLRLVDAFMFRVDSSIFLDNVVAPSTRALATEVGLVCLAGLVALYLVVALLLRLPAWGPRWLRNSVLVALSVSTAFAAFFPSVLLEPIARRERAALRRARLDSSTPRSTKDALLGLDFGNLPTGGRILLSTGPGMVGLDLGIPLADEVSAHAMERQRGLQQRGLINRLRSLPLWSVTPWTPPLERALIQARKVVIFAESDDQDRLTSNLVTLALTDNDGWRVLDALRLIRADRDWILRSAFLPALERLEKSLAPGDSRLQAEVFALKIRTQALSEVAIPLAKRDGEDYSSEELEALSRTKLELVQSHVAQGSWASGVLGMLPLPVEKLSPTARCRERLASHLAGFAEQMADLRPGDVTLPWLGWPSDGCVPGGGPQAGRTGLLEDHEQAAQLDLRRLQGITIPEEALRWEWGWMPLHHAVGSQYSLLNDIIKAERKPGGEQELLALKEKRICEEFAAYNLAFRGTLSLAQDYPDGLGFYRTVRARLDWQNALQNTLIGSDGSTDLVLKNEPSQTRKVLLKGVACALGDASCLHPDPKTASNQAISELRQLWAASASSQGLVAYLAAELESGIPQAESIKGTLAQSTSSHPTCVKGSPIAMAYSRWRMARLAFLRGDRKLAVEAQKCEILSRDAVLPELECWRRTAEVYATLATTSPELHAALPSEAVQKITKTCQGNHYPQTVFLADALISRFVEGSLPQEIVEPWLDSLVRFSEGRGYMWMFGLEDQGKDLPTLETRLYEAQSTSSAWQHSRLREIFHANLAGRWQRSPDTFPQQGREATKRVLAEGFGWHRCELLLIEVATRPLGETLPPWLDKEALRQGCIRNDEEDEIRKVLGQAVLCRDHEDKVACTNTKFLIFRENSLDLPFGWPLERFASFRRRVTACLDQHDDCKKPWSPLPPEVSPSTGRP